MILECGCREEDDFCNDCVEERMDTNDQRNDVWPGFPPKAEYYQRMLEEG